MASTNYKRRSGAPRWGILNIRLKRVRKLPELMTANQLARILNVDEHTVRVWIKKEALPAYRDGANLMLNRADVLLFLYETGRFKPAKI